MERARRLGFIPELEPRQVINISIVVLTLFVISLSGVLGLNFYKDYRAHQQMVHANATADHLIRAVDLLAMERGLTAANLGSSEQARIDTRLRLAELRQQSDIAWDQALNRVRNITDSVMTEPSFAVLIESARKAYTDLQGLRVVADGCLKHPPSCPLDGAEWLETITTFIKKIERVREDMFLNVDSSRRVLQFNLTLKRWAALASENAGRERGILAWHISAGLPLSDTFLDELKSHRGVVNRTIREIIAFSDRHAIDPRLSQAVETMQRVFLQEFEKTRRAVYATADQGVYGVDAEHWVEESTRAIGSLLAISNLTSEITAEYAQEISAAYHRQLLLYLLLAVAALGMSVLGLTRVRQTANEMYRQKEMAEITLHSIGDAVITTDAEARVEYLNPVAQDLTGWSNEEARGRRLNEIFHIINGLSREPQDNPIEACLRERHVVGLASDTILVRRDGTELVIEDSAAPIIDRDGEITGAVMVFYDVSLMRRVPHLLSYHATHDALTGLINRREFERRLAELLVESRQTGQQHALAYLDLDQFKLVNDTCGHGVGDRLLCQITYLLKEKVRDADTLARLGGDEFGLLLENCSLEKGYKIADTLRQTIKNFRFAWETHTFDIGITIGLVPINAESANAAEVLSDADAACFVAKDKGRNRIQIYQPGDLEMARRHGEMQWVSRLHKALDEERFRLYFQFIRPMNGDETIHGEVLLRLLDEGGEIIPPMAFLPAAERYNLMPLIDRWVIRNALASISNWLKEQQGCCRMVCNINLSGASLGEESLQEYIEEQLAHYRVPPELICFEVTESVAIANLERAATLMRNLRQRGCRFALDDFGSGLSSFAYLKALPVDYLKIDGVFVKDVVHDPVARAMVQAIHNIGHIMGLQIVAEYVENEEISAIIREIGVDYAQGYAIGYPQPIVECMRSCTAGGSKS
ncbi:MAG: EAL domain-containing protein [Gammaproteobacteria bacterium]|nr:EAL domain-containing protein [Gammaproteobacteria bacterium]